MKLYSVGHNVVSGSSQVTGIGNSQLSNSSVTIGDSSISLGGTDTTLTGLTDIDMMLMITLF